jgi:hypothetical protein
MKTAQALYEIVPLSIYSPYLFVMMRIVAKANTQKAMIRFIGVLLMSAPLMEGTARYMRDKMYWPLVK